jgi:hypothetical protein
MTNFLSTVHFVLDPRTGSLAGFVDGILALGDDTFEPKLLGNPDQLRHILR